MRPVSFGAFHGSFNRHINIVCPGACNDKMSLYVNNMAVRMRPLKGLVEGETSSCSERNVFLLEGVAAKG